MPLARLPPARLGGEGNQCIEVRLGLPVQVQGLDTDMAASRLNMGLQALSTGVPLARHKVSGPGRGSPRAVDDPRLEFHDFYASQHSRMRSSRNVRSASLRWQCAITYATL
jgi:hypothetical protein